MVQYRLKKTEEKIIVEVRKNEDCHYESFAGFDENSRIIFYGDFSNEICEEIIDFLHTQCIHVDENGIAYQLVD